MRRAAFVVLAAIAGLSAREARGDDDTDPANGALPSADLPFYDAGGAQLPLPPPPPRPKHPFILAPAINVSDLYLPSLSSGGILVEPMVEAGNDFWAIGAGYSNLAGVHGFDIDGSFGEWASGARLFDSGRWRGTWLVPDAHVRFAYYVNAGPRRPAFTVGGTTKIGGLRFAACLGKVSFEMSAAADVGMMLVKIDQDYFGLLFGGHVDVGVAFWP